LRLPFRIYKVQSDGDLHFVEGVQTFDEAKDHVRGLGELWPGVESPESTLRSRKQRKWETK
jgi:hypothetical protein